MSFHNQIKQTFKKNNGYQFGELEVTRKKMTDKKS